MKREQENSREAYNEGQNYVDAYSTLRNQREALALQRSALRMEATGRAIGAVGRAAYKLGIEAPAKGLWAITTGAGRGLLNIAGLGVSTGIALGKAYIEVMDKLTDGIVAGEDQSSVSGSDVAHNYTVNTGSTYTADVDLSK